MRIVRWMLALAVIGAGTLWFLARPHPLAEADVAGLTGDAAKGEQVFWAAGCASCHMAPDARGEAQLVLAGGQRFPSDFGTFVAPNISQDPEQGIGGWSLLDLANALTRGVGREGEHLYPALPYASYAKMKLQDVADLYAFLQTLPADPTPSRPHELAFPFSLRQTLGVWKLLYLNGDWAIPGSLTPTAERGRYIAEALAHCGECHTPRTLLGGMDSSRWFGGAPNPSGQGRIPNITPAKLGWTAPDIVQYLTTGFTPEFDSVGGHMAHVVENMARLPEADRQAVAEYLLTVPNVE
jgi:mono/diheme cytochrome c family protein